MVLRARPKPTFVRGGKLSRGQLSLSQPPVNRVKECIQLCGLRENVRRDANALCAVAAMADVAVCQFLGYPLEITFDCFKAYQASIELIRASISKS